MTNSKQQVADLRAELVERTAKVQAAQRTKTELAQRISQLTGAMALDGIDHSKRIAQAQTELTAANTLLATWPDVQAELNRRIGEVEQVISADKLTAATQRYTVLAELEAQQRREFASQVVALAETSKRLRATIDERQQLHSTLHKAGVSLPPRPSNGLPEFRADWVYRGQPSEAAAMLKDLL